MSASVESAEGSDTAERRGAGSIGELVVIVAAAIALAFLIQAFLVKPFRIPSESMVPTLEVTQRVLVDRVSYRFSTPDRGDIVVFHPPIGAESSECGAPVDTGGEPCPEPTAEPSEENFIKRVVALPGDRLRVLGGRVYLNGERQAEPFIRPDDSCGICNEPREITIPPDHFFMMGDNRGQSADSREWGPVPKDWIVGHAFATYWPPTRIGGL